MRQKPDAGNALFLILIGVALFAALSYAVTQAGRGGGTAQKEQVMLAISEMMQYGASIQQAAQRLKIINGCTDFNINYRSNLYYSGGSVYQISASPSDGSCGIFHTNGGGVPFKKPPATVERVATTDYQFTGRIAIPGVGTAEADAVMVVEITDEACLAVNSRVGVSGGTPVAKSDANWRFTTPESNWKVLSQWRIDNGHSHYSSEHNAMASLSGHTAGCFKIASASNYYHVIIER